MMKRFTALALLALILPPLTYAQKYEMSFVMPQEGVHDSMLYIGQHYRDQFRVLDSARLDKKGTYTFAGNRKWETGIYALLQKDAKKSLIDFTIDGSQRFTIRLTEANEVANRAFIDDRIGFEQIADIIEKTMEKIDFTTESTLETYLQTDKEARREDVQRARRARGGGG